MRRAVLLFVLITSSTGNAEPPVPRRVVVETSREAFTATPADATGSVLYLNRCSGGCMITGGSINDATMQVSTIPPAGNYTIEEYKNAQGLTGTAADDEWKQVVDCMKDVYSPYNVTVTDVLPQGVPYNEAIVAGRPQQAGLGNDILGIAPLAGDCSAQLNVISFSFANYHSNIDRVNNICWTAAQESGHAYGLDHQYVFTDGESACSDPTTYRADCGGRKFFRNRYAKCGEEGERKCHCSSTQNSHQKLLGVFGAGVVTTAPPTASIIAPTGGTVSTGWVVHAQAGSERGVAKVELFLNGSRWMVLPGVKFGRSGQLNPADYQFNVPSNVPDGIIDIAVHAYDDLGAEVVTSTVTVTKGSPCTSASTCLAEQSCTDGKCVYPPPTGELGDSCGFNQACKSWSCLEASNGDMRCTTDCRVDDKTTCPTDFTCLPTGDTDAGVCWPSDTGGCCSAAPEGSSVWMHFGLGGLVLGLVVRRRRKR